MALPKKNRLTTKKDIDRVFKRGRTVKGSFLFIKLLDNSRRYSRFAFIISSKHVPLAVDRNKIRRVLSGEVAKILLSWHGYDTLIVIYKKVEGSQFGELSRELIKLLVKM